MNRVMIMMMILIPMKKIKSTLNKATNIIKEINSLFINDLLVIDEVWHG